MDVKNMVREIARARKLKAADYIEDIVARGGEAIPELVELAGNRLERPKYRKKALDFVHIILTNLSERRLPWARHWAEAAPGLEQIVRNEDEHPDIVLEALRILKAGSDSIESVKVKLTVAAIMNWAYEFHTLPKVRREAKTMLDDF